MSPAISRGIVRAHRDGIVTSTSLLGNCDRPGQARARCWPRRPTLGVGVHLALVGGGPVADAARVPTLLTAGGALPRARHRVHRRAGRSGRSTPGDVEREFDAQIARVRAAGIAIDHLDTHHHLGFLPVVGRAVEAVARKHGIAGIRSAIETPTLSWVTDPRRGLKAGRADRPRLAHAPPAGRAAPRRRRAGATSRSGRLDEVRILEIIGRLGPGPHELICHPGERRATTELRPRRRRAARADVAEGAPRARTARHHACADGAICFERRA